MHKKSVGRLVTIGHFFPVNSITEAIPTSAILIL